MAASVPTNSRPRLDTAVELIFGRLEDYLDVIEVVQQLARERRHCPVVAGRGGMFERAAYLGHGVESVAAPFALDAMRDAPDLCVAGARDPAENRVDVGALVIHKTRNQIAQILVDFNYYPIRHVSSL